MATHYYGKLPQCSNKHERRETEIDHFVWNENNSARYDNESHENQRRVNAETIPYLRPVEPYKQRNKNHRKQSGVLHQKLTSH